MSQTTEIEGHLARMAAKQPRGLAGLYAEIGPWLYAICVTVSENDDIAQEQFLLIFKRMWAGAYRFPATNLSGQAWVVSIARGSLQSAYSDCWSDGIDIDGVFDPDGVGTSPLLTAMFIRGLSYDDIAGRLDMLPEHLRDWICWRDITLTDETADVKTRRAAEYALGVLDGDDARTFRRDVGTDLGLGAAYVFWMERFSAALVDFPGSQPPDHLRKAVLDYIDTVGGRRARVRDLVFRGAALCTCAVFVAVAAVMYFKVDTVAPYVATLSGPDADKWATLTFDTQTNEIRVDISPDADSQDGVDLWLRDVDGSVVAIGTILGTANRVFVLPNPDPTATLAGEFILRRHVETQNARGAFLARGRFETMTTPDNGATDLLDQLFLAFKTATVLDLVPRPNNFL